LDKYEYNLKIDQIKSLCAEGNYSAAAEIADSISWSKVKNVNMLVRVGEVYEKVGRYEESKEILLSAYDRSPIGRMIIYRLAEVAVKMNDLTEAEAYYNEFVEIAPHDNLRYVLRYEIEKARGTDISRLIDILEEFKEKEYTEEWAFELASLYHQANQSEKCVEACDELILWFGDGPYVERALELKMLYQPLSKVQEEKYRKFRLAKEGVTTIGADEMKRAGEFVHDPVEIPQVSVNPERFNTVNLQEEIAKGMQQIIDATEKETVHDTIDNIKKIVGDNIPYLQIQKPEGQKPQETAPAQHIETDEEIDGSLNTNFQEFLGEENDGQMSFVMNEQAKLERQITGQITIEDVLEEWEKTRRAAEAALQEAEQRKLESAKARALQEAGDIMDRLNDVIPRLDAGVSPRELLEEEYLQNMESPEAAGQLVSEMNTFLDQEIERLSAENARMDEQLAQAGMDNMQELTAEMAEEIVPEEIVLPEISMEGISDEETVVPDILPETDPEGDIGDIAVSEVLVDEPLTEDTEVPEVAEDEPLREDMEAFADETPMEEPEAPSEESAEENQEQDSVSEAAEETLDHAEEKASAKRKSAAEDNGYMTSWKIKTANLPEISVPEDLGLDDEPAEETVIDHLTDEQKAIFSYFVPVKGMETQLCQTLTGTVRHLKEDRTASTGNIIIQGGQGCGKTMLATSIIKVLQKECGHPNGKIGKIDAQALNKKDIRVLLGKVSGGCLIIERAGDLSRESAVTLSLLLAQDDSGILVILEDTSKGIRKALMQDDGFAKKFSEKVNVPIFTNDELVAFARAYAKELGYEIEEMAVLALYNRISNIQRLDQATTLTEVKEIVDEAIYREAHGGLKKAISILTAARYTDDDCIVLREKDFK
jgi:tetratricopeptide (TPR) repeat protein